jgi:hypothetical protein
MLIPCGDTGFSPEQVLCTWRDVLGEGHHPASVRILGVGGGDLSGAEYHIGLALGANVGVVAGSGGAADALIENAVWADAGGLLVLPLDAATIRGLIVAATQTYRPPKLEKMGRAFHERYVAGSTGRFPDNLKPWDKLDDTYKTANLEQARYAVAILEACGFKVQPARSPKVYTAFTKQDIERMAELEHGRWNVERLENGWRPGSPRDNDRKIHNCIVPWKDLPNDIKHYDRDAVKEFPAILAKAGLEVRRKRAS